MIMLMIIVPFRGKKKEKGVLVSAKEEKVAQNGGGVVRLPAPIGMARRVVVGEQEVGVRRALAIKKVKDEDKDNSNNCNNINNDNNNNNCLRSYSLFVTPRGVTLFTQSWSPLSSNVRYVSTFLFSKQGVVLLLHGLNEHRQFAFDYSGRYGDFAKHLNGIGIRFMVWTGLLMNVVESISYPLGHGGSDGLHAYVPNLDEVVADMKAFLDTILYENPDFPASVLHILQAALDPKVEAQIHGIVLTSPAVGVNPSHPIFSLIAPIASLLMPRYQCHAANKSGTVVCRDPEALKAKYSDPLVYTGAIRVRTGCEILRISTYLQENLWRLQAPFLVLHGSADAVTDPKASLKLHQEASATDKAIKLYDGLLHDILFEPENRL
ncbi:Caffeoylshikimate esterase [Bienertia sinuspersici]